MLTLAACCRSGLAPRFVWRRSFLVAAVLSLVVLPVGAVRAQDGAPVNPETGKAWARYAIAVIQAESGDDSAAKRTALQIGAGDVVASDVVGVCCMNGWIFYDHPPCSCCAGPALPSVGSYRWGWGGRDLQGNQYFLNRDRAGDHVPAKCPSDLRPDYLDPDPRHGAVVNFSDDRDSYGTRLTSRKYADGYVVIETPQPSRK